MLVWMLIKDLTLDHSTPPINSHYLLSEAHCVGLKSLPSFDTTTTNSMQRRRSVCLSPYSKNKYGNEWCSLPPMAYFCGKCSVLMLLQDYKTAKSLANEYKLDLSLISKNMWCSHDVTEVPFPLALLLSHRAHKQQENINKHLSSIDDLEWKLRECKERVPSTPKAVELLLQYDPLVCYSYVFYAYLDKVWLETDPLATLVRQEWRWSSIYPDQVTQNGFALSSYLLVLFKKTQYIPWIGTPHYWHARIHKYRLCSFSFFWTRAKCAHFFRPALPTSNQKYFSTFGRGRWQTQQLCFYKTRRIALWHSCLTDTHVRFGPLLLSFTNSAPLLHWQLKLSHIA